ncbi:MAG TPA: type II toxin-antitoxin system ParD family antitoxin [Acidisarcina sp.]
MPSVHVDLSEELDRFVASKVAGGVYRSASDVVTAALRTLEREEQEYEEKLATLRVALDEGFTSGIADGDVFARVREQGCLPVRRP